MKSLVAVQYRNKCKQSFAKIINDWRQIFFIIMPYKDICIPILMKLDILILLEEHIRTYQNTIMQGSDFIKINENEVKFLYILLFRMLSVIDE